MVVKPDFDALILSFKRGHLPASIITIVVVVKTTLCTSQLRQPANSKSCARGCASLIPDTVMHSNITDRANALKRLFAQLHPAGKVYFDCAESIHVEASCAFTIVKTDRPILGLVTVPEYDDDLLAKRLSPTNATVYKNCGNKK